MSLPLTLYRLATGLLEPLAPALLRRRAARGKEDMARLNERLGRPAQARPSGPLVWLHGVSVGESLSLLPLVERLRERRPDVTALVTTGTTTSAEVLAGRLPPGVIHQFAPVDGPRAIDGFLDHWRPDAAVLVESELWPNLVLGARRRGVRLILASARVTEKTADGWRRFPASARELLTAFDHVLPQDDASAERLAGLGAVIDGQVNLKLIGEPLPHDAAEFRRISEAIGDRPVIVAASTHEGEERAIVRALDALPFRACLILAPRHPDRAAAIAAELAQDGYRFALRSRGQPLDATTDLYVADTLGEMGLFLRLADVVVMGGSFAPSLGLPAVGGHNPLEPARLGKPAISGPDAGNWLDVARRLRDAGGLTFVASPADLPAAVARLIADPDEARDQGERARRAAAEAASGFETLWSLVEAALPRAAA